MFAGCSQALGSIIKASDATGTEECFYLHNILISLRGLWINEMFDSILGSEVTSLTNLYPYMNDLAPEIITFKLQRATFQYLILHASSGTLAFSYGDIYEVQSGMY